MVEPWQVVRVMAEVGVHLEDIVVAVLQSPFETGDVCCSKSLFASALDDEEPSGELLCHETLNNIASAVRASVVDNEYVECLFQSEHRTDYLLDVLLLIVSWDNDYAVAFVHCRILFCSPSDKYV